MTAAEDAARSGDLLADLLAMNRRAQRDLLNGDSNAYAELFEPSFDATLCGPFGGVYKGWLEIAPRLAAAAALFDPVAEESAIDPICATVTGDIVLVVARETNVVQLKTRARPAAWILRSTHVYRRGERGWRLLHRHADPLVERRSADETFATLV